MTYDTINKTLTLQVGHETQTITLEALRDLRRRNLAGATANDPSRFVIDAILSGVCLELNQPTPITEEAIRSIPMPESERIAAIDNLTDLALKYLDSGEFTRDCLLQIAQSKE